MGQYGRRASDGVGGAPTPPPTRWAGRVRYPEWREQFLQFLTRYLFEVLGIAFFLWPGMAEPLWWSAQAIVATLLLHAVLNTLFLLHARHSPCSLARYRLAMLVDIVAVAICVANDPHVIPPSLLAFIMVVLGNGMRYGMPLYGEALIATFVGAILALGLNHLGHDPVNQGVVFLSLFGAIILVYAFILLLRMERARDQLEHRSRRDMLTGTLNRRALEDAAEELLGRPEADGGAGCVAVLFADMDHFKAVNDREGHAAGDRALQGVARILQRAVRVEDVVGRYGGDEFVLLLPRADRECGRRAATRIQRALSAWAEQQALGCGVTFGVASFPADGADLDALLRVVDRALYRAKHEGRRGVVEVVCEADALPLPAAQRETPA